MAKENNQNNESDNKPEYRKKTLSVAQESIITADELVNGVKSTKDPLSEQHNRSKILLKALNNNKALKELDLDEYQRFSTFFDKDVYDITVESSINARDAVGGTAKKQVINAIKQARKKIK